MFKPFRPRPPQCDCLRPRIHVRVLDAKIKLNTFATFPQYNGSAVKADWTLTDPNQPSFILNKPSIALSLLEQGLVTTTILNPLLLAINKKLEERVDILIDAVLSLTSTNPVLNKVVTAAIKSITGLTIKVGSSFLLVLDSILTNVNNASSITQVLAAIDKALTLTSGGSSGLAVVNKVQLLLNIVTPLVVTGVEVLLGGQIDLIEPTLLVANKYYLISNGFSGQLPEDPEAGSVIIIAFSKGSEAMSVFTTDGSSIGYISLLYGPKVTELYIGITEEGLLNTSTKYELVYDKSNKNWIIL